MWRLFVLALAASIVPALPLTAQTIDASKKACLAGADQKIVVCVRASTPSYCPKQGMAQTQLHEGCRMQPST